MASVTSGGAIVTRKLSVSIQGQCQPKTGNMSCLKIATTPIKSSTSGLKRDEALRLNHICQDLTILLKDLDSNSLKGRCRSQVDQWVGKSVMAMVALEHEQYSSLTILLKLLDKLLAEMLHQLSKKASVSRSKASARCLDILIRECSWKREDEWW